MKTIRQPSEPESEWQKTSYANLIRYKPSQTYFARFRVKGKLIRRSLKTKALSVAKLRLADLDKTERGRAQTQQSVAEGKMTFGDCLEIFKTRLENNPAAKPNTKLYYHYRIMALLKSWPRLADTDVSRITRSQCLDWGSRTASECSSYSHNHTISILRNVFEIAIESGARYDNPAMAIKRVREKTEKTISLPTFEQFGEIVQTIKDGGSGFSLPASELVEFLAYGGFRKTEARYVTWLDCDFKRGEILVHGHPETGTKNSEVRRVPMIPSMRKLLEQVQSERLDEKPESPVMRVWECQKSLDRATRLLKIKRITHHDLRHLFATRAIESGVDVPTVSRWLGHKDGGALAMKTYGHLRNEHSQLMAQKVKF